MNKLNKLNKKSIEFARIHSEAVTQRHMRT